MTKVYAEDRRRRGGIDGEEKYSKVLEVLIEKYPEILKE